MRGSPPAADRQVTLANWREPPYNRWAFRHVREIVATAAIARAGRSWRLGRELGAVEDIVVAAPDGGELTVAEWLDRTWTDGFIVLRRGTIVAERYDAGHDAATPHIVFSVSKSVSGLIAGILADRGLLDVDAPVARYLPEAEGSAYGDCTVRHVLDMTVAVSFREDYLDRQGEFARYRQATAWNPVDDPRHPPDLRSFLVTLKGDGRAHGEAFHYVSPNSDLLGWVIERATGGRFADAAMGHLWRPMGAEFDAYVTVDRLGAARAAGGVCMSLRDMARVGEMVRCRGLANGRQVVPGWWIDDMFANGDREAWLKGDLRDLLPAGRYRSQWYVPGHGQACAIGIHGQWIHVDRKAAVVIAKQSSQPLPIDDALDRLNLAAFAAIAKALQ